MLEVLVDKEKLAPYHIDVMARSKIVGGADEMTGHDAELREYEDGVGNIIWQ
jgi:hypothetical protein